MSHILIADDEPGIRQVLTCWLAEQGHQITCASSGDAAIRLLSQVQPDLVITDIRMPPGDGIQVLVAARKLDPRVAVIVMTGHKTTARDADEMKELGADDHLCKPFHLAEFDRSVTAALRRGETRRSQRA